MSGSQLRPTISSLLAFCRYVELFISYAVQSRCYKHPNVTLSPVFQYSEVFVLKQNALLHTNYFIVNCSVGKKQSEAAVVPISKSALNFAFFSFELSLVHVCIDCVCCVSLTADFQSLNSK